MENIELAAPLALSEDEEQALQKLYAPLCQLLKVAMDAGLAAIGREPERARAAQERARDGWAVYVTALSTQEDPRVRLSCWQSAPDESEKVELFCLELEGGAASTQPPVKRGILN